MTRHETTDIACQGQLAQAARNPRAGAGTSIMPEHGLPEAHLKALADFLLSLDFSRHGMKILKREEVAGAIAK